MSIGQIAATDSVAPASPVAAPGSPAPGTSASAPGVSPSLAPVSTSQTTTPPASSTQADSTLLQQSVSSLNAHLKNVGNNSVEFSINSSTGQVVVQVVDTQTQAVLMQTPSKEAIAIAQAQVQSQDNPRGLLIRTQA